MKKRDLAILFGGAIGAAVAIKFVTRAATVDWADVADKVVHSDRSRFVSIDGVRIHYQEFGDANDPPIILLHGYTASAYVWHTSAPLLAHAGLRIIAIDFIGFGYSGKPRGFDYTIESQGRMVLRFMDRLGIDRAVLAGSSYGGAVASILALDAPERVDKLVLVDTVCNDDLKNHPILKLVSFPLLGEIITPFLADSRALTRFRMNGTIARANHHLVTDERVESIRRPLFAADGHHSLLATSRNWHASRIERDAHLIRQPTLIIWGEDDTVIPIRDGYKLRDMIPNSRLVIFKDCGHLPHEERSDLFSQFVGGFCGSRSSK